MRVKVPLVRAGRARSALIFALAGALLYCLRHAPLTRPGADAITLAKETIRLTPGTLEILRQRSLRQRGRLPSPPELAALIKAEIDDEVLFREALARELYRDDIVVRQRLAANLRFLGIGRPGASDRRLAEEAIELGMHQSDTVVRRRLITNLKLETSRDASKPEPSDSELLAYLDEHSDDFLIPTRVGIVQLYFSTDNRSTSAPARLEDILERLRNADISLKEAPGLAEAFLLPAKLPLRTRDQLAADLGAAFADEVFLLETQRWHGPLVSSFGTHLVYVYQRVEARAPKLEEVREGLRLALLAQRAAALLGARIAELRTNYRVVVTSPPRPAEDGR